MSASFSKCDPDFFTVNNLSARGFTWPSRFCIYCLKYTLFFLQNQWSNFLILNVTCSYLALDCNKRSGHQARELKNVYIDSPATVVRLVFHNCHCNEYNAYNQVGCQTKFTYFSKIDLIVYSPWTQPWWEITYWQVGLMVLILTGEPLDEQKWELLTQCGFEDLLQTPRYHSVGWSLIHFVNSLDSWYIECFLKL